MMMIDYLEHTAKQTSLTSGCRLYLWSEHRKTVELFHNLKYENVRWDIWERWEVMCSYLF